MMRTLSGAGQIFLFVLASIYYLRLSLKSLQLHRENHCICSYAVSDMRYVLLRSLNDSDERKSAKCHHFWKEGQLE